MPSSRRRISANGGVSGASRLDVAMLVAMLALLPATATVIGVVVLRNVPTIVELVEVGLVVIGVAATDTVYPFDA